MTLYAQMAVPDSHRFPSNLYLTNNVKDIVIFQGLKLLILIISTSFLQTRNAQVTLVMKPQLKTICFQDYKR